MRVKTRESSPRRDQAALEQVQSELDEWRRTRKRPHDRIPEELWSKATELAVRLGLYQVHRALRLHYADLKRRVDVVGTPEAQSPLKAQVATFVELLPGPVNTVSECALEVESPRGARLRVVIKNIASRDVGAILRDFAEVG